MKCLGCNKEMPEYKKVWIANQVFEFPYCEKCAEAMDVKYAEMPKRSGRKPKKE